MDVLGVNHMKSPKERKRRRSSKDVKVTYISSPMKVKTCATKFRALVQELTGRDSDAERFMETNNDTNHQNVHEFSREQQQLNGVADRENHALMPQLPFSNSFYEFPNCSDSLFDPFSGHFQMDVLRSFDQM